MQDCSDSIANALELLWSCAKSSISRVSSAGCMVLAIESMFLQKDKALLARACFWKKIKHSLQHLQGVLYLFPKTWSRLLSANARISKILNAKIWLQYQRLESYCTIWLFNIIKTSDIYSHNIHFASHTPYSADNPNEPTDLHTT